MSNLSREQQLVWAGMQRGALIASGGVAGLPDEPSKEDFRAIEEVIAIANGNPLKPKWQEDIMKPLFVFPAA